MWIAKVTLLGLWLANCCFADIASGFRSNQPLHVLELRIGSGTLTETAYQAGYSDQAHFIKDFRNFTGLAPQSCFTVPAVFVLLVRVRTDFSLERRILTIRLCGECVAWDT